MMDDEGRYLMVDYVVSLSCRVRGSFHLQADVLSHAKVAKPFLYLLYGVPTTTNKQLSLSLSIPLVQKKKKNTHTQDYTPKPPN